MAELPAVLIDVSSVAPLLAAWSGIQGRALKYGEVTIFIIMIACIKSKHVSVARDGSEELVFAILPPVYVKL
jgi:hypothetical protein